MRRTRVYKNTTRDLSEEGTVSSNSEPDPLIEPAAAAQTSHWERWVRRTAFLGDSQTALCISALLLALSVAQVLHVERTPYNRLGPIPVIDEPHIFHLTAESVWNEEMNPKTERHIIAAYLKDGVVAVRGLIDASMLRRLLSESDTFISNQLDKRPSRSRGSTQFFTAKHGVIFRNNTSAFQEIALNSSVSRFAAFLLRKSVSPKANITSIRMLRDIFLSKDKDPYVCGYHVDDFGFWPATPESEGVNAWVALNDMPVDRGGGVALAVGSHIAPWRRDAYLATGASAIFPERGYIDAKDMIERRSGAGTCNLKDAAPHLHQRMEETKRIYHIKKGDVIFHTRWLFHRTVAFNQSLIDRNQDPIYRRYSIRYAPGSAIIPPGFSTEYSVLWNQENAGRTADEVVKLDGPWYPRVWPSVNDDEVAQLQSLADEKLSVAERERESKLKEMAPIIKRKVQQMKITKTKHVTPSPNEYI